MAKESIPKFDIPPEMRQMAEQSVEQARKAFDGFIAAGETLGRRLAEAQCRPAATLLGISRLALPEVMVEIEATAMA